ncbi:hypothetical protein [Mucilaginibacter psychrotolerans]|uniref:Uncharacterized protein n=1 Tax=Mucilaginibacter psychrotolerans TaxID=1524096 RepID=A0A4Y8RYD1_9SPHI|nr:hypothetical protein [Mucilaginibacter psychrotolerans]TFF30420.1 hypothetical protein E2R66_27225 [Mucilaginibacter psychrotolerans]
MANDDLHHGNLNGSGHRHYVEFYFHCCFDELLRNTCDWESELSGTEILDVFNFLEIDFDRELVVKGYNNHLNHSVEVFHSRLDERVFAYFDLQKEPTDQNDMFFLGISCTAIQEPTVHEMLLKIYKKLGTTSAFSFDIRNKILYNKVFHSTFYFYKLDQEMYKRKMNHHNLMHH